MAEMDLSIVLKLLDNASADIKKAMDGLLVEGFTLSEINWYLAELRKGVFSGN